MLIDKIMREYPDSKISPAVINVQNVAEYSWGDPKHSDDGYIENCFSYRLPFPVVWFEFKSQKSSPTDVRVPCGMLAWIEEHASSARSFNTLSYFEYQSQVGCFGGIRLLLDKSYKSTPALGGYLLRRPDPFVYTVGFRVFHANNEDISNEPSDQIFAKANLPVITTALNFLHCKNVDIVENHIPKKLVKANILRGKERPYSEKHYTLAIEPMKRILNTEGQAQSVGIKKAFHICRGHFKTYDEKPLFGKLRGTFWTPAHLKGSVERGIIKKDYEIRI